MKISQTEQSVYSWGQVLLFNLVSPSAGDMVWEFKRKLYCTANKISEEYYKDLQSEATKTSLQNYFDGLSGFPVYGDGQEYSFYFEKC